MTSKLKANQSNQNIVVTIVIGLIYVTGQLFFQ